MDLLTKASERAVRVPRPLLIGAGLAILPAIAIGSWQATRDGALSGLGAGAAILIAGLVAATALSLPGKSPEGLLLGIAIPFGAMMTWTHLNQPRVVWAVMAVIGLTCVIATFPWWRDWRDLPRLGGFWLVIPVWAFGTVSALGVGHWTVAAQRVIYGGYALLVLLLVYQGVRRRGRDVSIGLVAGLLLGHAALLVAGCQYVFVSGHHFVPDIAWSFRQDDRFWGGPWLVYHPNFIGMTAVIAALRVFPDRGFRMWQRVAVFATAMFVLVIVASRTSFLIAGMGTAVFALAYCWRAGVPRWRVWSWLSTADRRRAVGRAVAPLLALCLVFMSSGGMDLLLKNRYGGDDADSGRFNSAVSGRADVWAFIGRDFSHDSVVEKVFGNADNSRGYVLRYPDPSDERYEEQPKLTADNGPVGALRRGGILGVLAVVGGIVLVVWRAVRRQVPIWVPVATLGVLAGGLTEDEITGTTPAWLIIFAAEVWVLYRASRPADEPAEPGEPELSGSGAHRT